MAQPQFEYLLNLNYIFYIIYFSWLHIKLSLNIWNKNSMFVICKIFRCYKHFSSGLYMLVHVYYFLGLWVCSLHKLYQTKFHCLGRSPFGKIAEDAFLLTCDSLLIGYEEKTLNSQLLFCLCHLVGWIPPSQVLGIIWKIRIWDLKIKLFKWSLLPLPLSPLLSLFLFFYFMVGIKDRVSWMPASCLPLSCIPCPSV